MYEFGKNYETDEDFLGKATVEGHLLECGAQVTGGYFADPGKKMYLNYGILDFQF